MSKLYIPQFMAICWLIKQSKGYHSICFGESFEGMSYLILQSLLSPLENLLEQKTAVRLCREDREKFFEQQEKTRL